MFIRGIRGATTVMADQAELVVTATQELLSRILEENPGLCLEDVASIIFTLTDDLSSIHPATAARQMGWNLIPMICTREIPVPGSLPRCIRVLIHWNTENTQNAIKHIYLHDAVVLRPDLMSK